MKQKSFKKTALIMVVLVVSLVFNSAFALGQLSNVQAAGSRNVEGIVQENDFIVFKTNVELTGDPQVTPDQVILGGTMEFDTCSQTTDGIECKLQFPTNGTTRFDPGPVPYTIELLNDAGTAVDEVSRSLFVDNKAPIVEEVSVDQALVSSGTVKIQYTVTDRACSASSCSGECAGISKIDIFEREHDFHETITISSDSCFISDSIDISTQKFTEGIHTLYVQAFDKVGQPSSENSITFDLDKNAPFIDVNTFKLVDAIDFDIAFFGPRPTPVTAKVEVKDVDLKKNSVVGDFSEIGGGASVIAQCGDTVEGITICTWDLTLNPGSSGIKTITIDAMDNSGNSGKTIISKDFRSDVNGPIVLQIESANQKEGKNFAKLRNNTIIATFRDDVGVSPVDAVLKVDGAEFIADTCSPAFNEWKCFWNDVSFQSSGMKNVLIDATTTDRLGNAVGQPLSQEILVDREKPRLTDVNLEPVGGSEELIAQVFKTGDKIFVEAVISDEFIETAFADFSRFVSGESRVQAESCTQIEDGKFVCTFLSSGINVPGFVNANVNLEIVDVAGNVAHAAESMKVFGTEGESGEDFWISEVQCSPNLLDRETFGLIDQKAFCHINLIPNEVAGHQFGDLEAVDITVGQCTGDISFAQDFRLFGAEGNQAYVEVLFRKQTANVNEITFICPLNIVTRKGDTIYTTPEAETVTVKFDFYNMPLGELSSSVQEKIDAAVEDANGILSIVGTLSKLFNYAEMACNLISMFNGFSTMFGQLKTAIGFGGPVTLPETIATCRGEENARAIEVEETTGLQKFCNFINCRVLDPNREPTDPVDAGDGDDAWYSDLLDFDGFYEGIDSLRGTGYEFVNDKLGGDIAFDLTGRSPQEYMNPKDSLIVATLTACIPGVIYGLDRYRQIQCMYADCMKTAVGEQGLPMYVCEDQKSYATCKYITGELFSVIPFTALFDFYANKIRSVLSNPLELIGALLAVECSLYCDTGQSEGHTLCTAPKAAAMIANVVQQVTSVINPDSWQIAEDYCDRLDEEEGAEE